MKLCWIGIHNYGKFESFSKMDFTSTNRYEKTRYKKVVQVRKCEICGKSDYSEQNVKIGYK